MNKMKNAVPQRGDFAYEFLQLENTLPPAAVSEWRTAIELWDADPKVNPNPFKVLVKGASISHI